MAASAFPGVVAVPEEREECLRALSVAACLKPPGVILILQRTCEPVLEIKVAAPKKNQKLVLVTGPGGPLGLQSVGDDSCGSVGCHVFEATQDRAQAVAFPRLGL